MDEKTRTYLIVFGFLLYLGGSQSVDPQVAITQPNVELKTVRLGETVKIECRGSNVKTDTFVSLGWQYIADGSINPVNINNSNTHEIAVTSTSTTVHVTTFKMRNVTYSQEGYYYCHLVTYLGEATAYIEIRVQGAPVIDTTLSTHPDLIEATLGEALEIECYVRGRPTARVTWLKDGSEITTLPYSVSTTPSITSSDAQSILSVFPLTREELGVYVCRARNSEGTVEKKWEVRATPRLVLTHPSPSSSTVLYGQQLIVECEGINFDDNQQIYWHFTSDIQNMVAVESEGKYRITRWIDATGVIWSELAIDGAYFSDQGSYMCSSRDLSQDVYVYVYGQPIINVNPPTVTSLPGDTVTLTCNVIARPQPDVIGWFRGSYQLGTSTTSSGHNTVETKTGTLNSRSVLTIHALDLSDYGDNYMCKAANSEGAEQVRVTIKDVDECSDGNHTCDTANHEVCADTLGSYNCTCRLGYVWGDNQCVDLDECSIENGRCAQICDNSQGSYHCGCQQGFVLMADRVTCMASNEEGTTSANTQGGNPVAVGLGVGLGLLALIIIVIIVVIFCRRRGQNKRELVDVPNDKSSSPVRGFYNTAYSVEADETHIYTELNPNGDEFPRGRIRFLNSLGEGKFGRVVKAEALSISRGGKWEEVAVKMVKETATDAIKEDFYHELMIVKKIPAHANVVKYLGCVTAADPVLIIMEYVNGGDLLTYLRKRRPEGGSTDEVGENDLLQKDMLSYALQIARGLAHIASLKIVHRDVAARNVLIDRKHVCKISDFGLARDVEGTDVYERTHRGPLPIRWMAPESLADSMHTTKSDVWAYGVLLWEIVTLGASPYPGMSGQMVMAAVLEGKRLLCPPQCSQQMYDVMSRCWEVLPNSRPSFSELSRDFERMLEEEGDYIQLDHIEEGIYQVLEGARSEEKL